MDTPRDPKVKFVTSIGRIPRTSIVNLRAISDPSITAGSLAAALLSVPHKRQRQNPPPPLEASL